MISRERVQLVRGTKVEVERFQPDGISSTRDPDALWELVVRPREAWMSRAEAEHFTRMLRGRLVGTDADSLYSAWIGDQPVAQVSMARAADNLGVGLVAYVITDPGHRGLGLCPMLMERMMADFVATGGECALLSTANPTAHAIYARLGFQDYNGHVMRYLSPSVGAEAFDRAYFDYRGPARVRAAHWGDAARMAWLYVMPSAWFVKDYGEALYDHPLVTHLRCGSILPAMMLNVEERGGGLWVLESEDRRIVGAATLRLLDTVAQARSPVVDLLVVPAYMEQAGGLLQVAVDTAAAAGAERVHAWLASCDRQKAEIVQSCDFRLEATLPGQFAVGKERFDMVFYTHHL